MSCPTLAGLTHSALRPLPQPTTIASSTTNAAASIAAATTTIAAAPQKLISFSRGDDVDIGVIVVVVAVVAVVAVVVVVVVTLRNGGKRLAMKP